MLEFLQENQLLCDIKFTDFRRSDKKNKLLKWCCGGLSWQTSLRHTCSHGLDCVGSAQASRQQVRVAPCNTYKSWLSLDPLCVAAHHTFLGACGGSW